MDTHLIADNPISGNEHQAIVRTIHPVSIFEVIDGHHLDKRPHKLYSFISSDGMKEDYTLCIHYFMLPAESTNKEEAFKYMDEAWVWFMSYMKWQDESFED